MSELDKLAARKSKQLKRTIKFKYAVPINSPEGYKLDQPYMGDYAARNEYWDTRMMQIPVDAVVPHLYASTYKCKELAIVFNVSKRTPCMISETNKYLELLPTILDRIRAKTIQAGNKEIWVTEFNIDLGFDNDVRSLYDFVNSPEHINVVKKMTTIFENKKIENYLFHILISDGHPYSAIRKMNESQGSRFKIEGSELGASNITCALLVNSKSNIKCD
jgi:hypothetical protein